MRESLFILFIPSFDTKLYYMIISALCVCAWAGFAQRSWSNPPIYAAIQQLLLVWVSYNCYPCIPRRSCSFTSRTCYYYSHAKYQVLLYMFLNFEMHQPMSFTMNVGNERPMFHAACKVDYQRLHRSNSQLIYLWVLSNTPYVTGTAAVYDSYQSILRTRSTVQQQRVPLFGAGAAILL